MNYNELMEKAIQASQYAYIPYSKFPVGAALLTDTGEVFTGCNVENASYGLTICAERVALTKAISSGFRHFVAIAIYGPTKKYISPCGACRQFISEFGNNIDIVMGNRQGEFTVAKSRELLPGAFSLNEEE